jgi:hypothetical protein
VFRGDLTRLAKLLGALLLEHFAIAAVPPFCILASLPSDLLLPLSGHSMRVPACSDSHLTVGRGRLFDEPERDRNVTDPAMPGPRPRINPRQQRS